MTLHTLPEPLQLALNLAKAREIFVLERGSHMPPDGRAQRDKLLTTFERIIDDSLAQTAERLLETPAGLGELSGNAWAYIAERQKNPQRTPPLSSAYENLARAFDERSDLQHADMEEGLLSSFRNYHFDRISEADMDDAASAITIFMHRSMTDTRVIRWLEEVRAQLKTLDEPQRRNFALMERIWLEAAGLDEKLVSDVKRATNESNKAWEQFKPKSDFAAWLPHFEEVVQLTRDKGALLAKTFNVTPYQALLQSFNPGLSNDTVNKVFSEIRPKLPGLVTAIMKKQAASRPLPLPPVPIEAQRRIAKRLAPKLGLAESFSRLDESAHPFSVGQWDDVRITTRYRENDLLFALASVVHETGHGLYSHALPREWKGQPLGDAQSMWVHESQSLFWEKQIGCSREFMQFISPIIHEELNKAGIKADGPEWTPENFYRLLTHVKPSLIRTEADEVTYPAHVILRHDLEQKLIDGSLAPKDVPAAWGAAMRELLGVEVPDHAHGCMQDVHWPIGALGYFPAYTFGALGAAQLMEKLRQEMPGVSDLIKNGDFAPIREWLKERIHRHGSFYNGEELFEKATGKPLSAEPWLKHIEERYLGS